MKILAWSGCSKDGLCEGGTIARSRPKKRSLKEGEVVKVGAFAALLSAQLVVLAQSSAMGQTTPLPAPAFHHLHLNSVDPDAAIDFYTRQFPTTSKATWGGLPALKSPTNVLVLFDKVATPPATSPDGDLAFWLACG